MRIAGGLGNDTIHGGPEDDLIEAGFGSDHLYGGAGADGLIGSTPGPTFLYGGADGDLLAAGGGCAGGAPWSAGPAATTPPSPRRRPIPACSTSPSPSAGLDRRVRGCDSVHLSPTNEDMEGSFDCDVLIGDGRANSMLGQPGVDRFYGGGGDDVIDARDGVRD